MQATQQLTEHAGAKLACKQEQLNPPSLLAVTACYDMPCRCVVCCCAGRLAFRVLQEVTKRSGKKGKGKGGKGKGSSASEEESAASKPKFKACSSFFQFFMPDTSSSSSSKQVVHPSMLPFTPEDDEDEEVSSRLGIEP